MELDHRKRLVRTTKRFRGRSLCSNPLSREITTVINFCLPEVFAFIMCSQVLHKTYWLRALGGSHGKSTALSESPSPSSKYWASTLGKQEHCLVILITRHKHSFQCQVRWGDGLNVLLIFYTMFITYSNKSEKLTHLVTNFWGSPKWKCVQAVSPGPH